MSLEEGKERCRDLLQSQGFGFVSFLPLEHRPRPHCRKGVVKGSGVMQACSVPWKCSPSPTAHLPSPAGSRALPSSPFLQWERECPNATAPGGFCCLRPRGKQKDPPLPQLLVPLSPARQSLLQQMQPWLWAAESWQEASVEINILCCWAAPLPLEMDKLGHDIKARRDNCTDQNTPTRRDLGVLGMGKHFA